MNEKNRLVKNAVCLIIETEEGWLLQVRDDKAGIWTPGKTNHWGGAFEPEDEGEPELAAYRELREETGLEKASVTLEHFLTTDYESTTQHGEPTVYKSYCYLVRILDDSRIYVHEGQDYMLIPFEANLDDRSLNLSSLAHYLLTVLSKRRHET